MIKLKNLSFTYQRQKPLFDALDLQLSSGQIYGLLGPNGAGKTTLLEILCGLRFPKSGDLDVLGYRPKDRRRDFLNQVFYLAEDHYIPPVSIRTLLRMQAPFYPQFDSPFFTECLDAFQLDSSERLDKLSYGQRRKAMIAFGLATRCRLLLLDEPAKGLDIPSRRQFRQQLSRSLQPEQTVLFSTHQVGDIRNMIDSLIILRQGRILLAESIEEIEDRVCLQFQTSEPTPGDCLYYQSAPGGYLCLRPSDGSGDSLKMDLEVLFNAAIASPEAFQAIFLTTQKTLQHENY